ncbi:MAG: DUF1573 domain-containing protein [Thermoguttaceae bacterium]|jgi:mRNA-degrading endonuclease toxin of MazEF toxin-antitoxin module|nr:DUF1573 domain-containing protein [Thermoguttaceae bacterium]
MRTWVVAVVASALGIAMGLSMAMARIAMRPWDGTPAGLTTSTEAAKVAPSGPQPKVVVPTTSYDFGLMDNSTPGRHDFVIRNEGDAILTLQKGDTTCKCTLAALDKTEVRPGESAVVTVEWHGRDFTGPYRQTAAVLTNDPTRHRVAFTVTGRITTTVKAVPSEVALSGLTAVTGREATVQLYCFKSEPFKIVGHECSDRATAGAFEVRVDPMPADQLASETGAKSGCLVHLTVKPGLPLGAFQQTITLKTNLASTPTVAIPVKGTVVGEIRIAGPMGWDPNTNSLNLGSLGLEEEIERSLTIFVHGPHAKDVRFEVLRREPELLEVQLGQNDTKGQLTRVPLTIRIPKSHKNKEPMDYSGSETAQPGTIVLGSNHPQAKELPIKVRFTIRK